MLKNNRGPWPPVFVERLPGSSTPIPFYMHNRGPWPPVFVERPRSAATPAVLAGITGGHGPRSSLSADRAARIGAGPHHNRGPWPPVFVERAHELTKLGSAAYNRGPWPPVFVERRGHRHADGRVVDITGGHGPRSSLSARPRILVAQAPSNNRGPWPPVFVERRRGPRWRAARPG